MSLAAISFAICSSSSKATCHDSTFDSEYRSWPVARLCFIPVCTSRWCGGNEEIKKVGHRRNEAWNSDRHLSRLYHVHVKLKNLVSDLTGRRYIHSFTARLSVKVWHACRRLYNKRCLYICSPLFMHQCSYLMFFLNAKNVSFSKECGSK